MKKFFYIFFSAITLILMLVVLELNHNTVLGFILIAVAAAVFYLLHHLIVKRKNLFSLKAAVWVGLIALYVGILFLTWPPTKAVPAVSVKNPENTQIVTLPQGELQGVYNEDKSVEVYTGIPYAEPPIGDLRWKEPRDAPSWEGVLVADHFAPMSMQPTNLPIYNSLAQIIGYHDYEISLDDNFIPPVSEDSLYLNIWKPATEEDHLPVLIYIHGGSLQTGQPWYQDYSGEGLAKGGVIVVNMGYRLGVFGYFASEELSAESENGTTGNYGLLDQIKALEWVKENISFFGGDPDNVTLSGESAGSASVSALCTSPLSKGLFKRVILESSTVASVNPPHSFRSLDNAIEAGKETLIKYGCTSVSGLRELPAQKIVKEADVHHHITVDGYALEETPYQSYQKGIHNEGAILHGYNSEESAAFLLFEKTNLQNYERKVRDYFEDYTDDILSIYPALTDEEAAKNWAEIYGAVFFDYPHYCLNRLAVRNQIPVYEYLFSKHNGRLGSWHSGEEVYCYGNIPSNSMLYDNRDRELSDEMQRCWINFIKAGDPNSDGMTKWSQNQHSNQVMNFGETTEIIREEEHALFDVLDKMDGWK